MERLQNYVRAHWRIISATALGVIVVCLLMLYRLGSLTGGISDSELQQQYFASSWHHLFANPLNAPLTVVEWLFLTIIPHHGQTVTRLSSIIFGVLAAAAFAYILRRWYGVRTALYGTALFGLSAWFLHISRFAGPDVMYLWGVTTLLAVFIAWERYVNRPLATLGALAALVVLLYIPGLVWLVLLSLGLQYQVALNGLHALGNWFRRTGAAALVLVLLVPLVLALASHTSLIATWLGLPHHLFVGNIPRHLVHSISFFVYRGPADSQLWLDRLPILNFFSVIMAVLGTIFYARHVLAPRTRLLASMFVLGAILYSLAGPVTISILVPIVYLVVTAGVGYLLHDWLRVFPRNPLARSVGFSLLALALALSCLYGLRAYYVAWPHNPATEATFHNRL